MVGRAAVVYKSRSDRAPASADEDMKKPRFGGGEWNTTVSALRAQRDGDIDGGDTTLCNPHTIAVRHGAMSGSVAMYFDGGLISGRRHRRGRAIESSVEALRRAQTNPRRWYSKQ